MFRLKIPLGVVGLLTLMLTGASANCSRDQLNQLQQEDFPVVLPAPLEDYADNAVHTLLINPSLLAQYGFPDAPHLPRDIPLPTVIWRIKVFRRQLKQIASVYIAMGHQDWLMHKVQTDPRLSNEVWELAAYTAMFEMQPLSCANTPAPPPATTPQVHR